MQKNRQNHVQNNLYARLGSTRLAKVARVIFYSISTSVVLFASLSSILVCQSLENWIDDRYEIIRQFFLELLLKVD